MKLTLSVNEKAGNMISLTDTAKTGTIILGFYRNGTHFLQDVIMDHNLNATAFGEICNDNTIGELEKLTELPGYKVCILNNTAPKFFLPGRQDLLKKWHVINLTRQDKIHHLISNWFWKKNTDQERLRDSGKFKHHGTAQSVYHNAAQQRSYYELSSIIIWLQEQLINHHIPSNATVDYSELVNYATEDISWQPNQYELLNLIDIFENHKEIEDLLTNYRT